MNAVIVLLAVIFLLLSCCRTEPERHARWS